MVSSGQSLDQLEAILYKKSAECSALSISMNTLQSKFNTIKEQVSSLSYKKKLWIKQIFNKNYRNALNKHLERVYQFF